MVDVWTIFQWFLSAFRSDLPFWTVSVRITDQIVSTQPLWYDGYILGGIFGGNSYNTGLKKY